MECGQWDCVSVISVRTVWGGVRGDFVGSERIMGWGQRDCVGLGHMGLCEVGSYGTVWGWGQTALCEVGSVGLCGVGSVELCGVGSVGLCGMWSEGLSAVGSDGTVWGGVSGTVRGGVRGTVWGAALAGTCFESLST